MKQKQMIKYDVMWSVIWPSIYFSVEVTLGDVKCVGVAKRNEDLQTRPDLLMWVESNEGMIVLIMMWLLINYLALPVLSVILTTTDGSTKIKPATRYHHNINCLLHPSVFIFDWKTAQCLAEFASLLTSTHKEYIIYHIYLLLNIIII